MFANFWWLHSNLWRSHLVEDNGIRWNKRILALFFRHLSRHGRMDSGSLHCWSYWPSNGNGVLWETPRRELESTRTGSAKFLWAQWAFGDVWPKPQKFWSAPALCPWSSPCFGMAAIAVNRSVRRYGVLFKYQDETAMGRDAEWLVFWNHYPWTEKHEKPEPRWVQRFHLTIASGVLARNMFWAELL